MGIESPGVEIGGGLVEVFWSLGKDFAGFCTPII